MAAAALVLLTPGLLVLAGDPVDFQRDVRPLLSDRCFQCHGPDGEAREAELRLDTRAGATDERRFGPALVPGDVQESLLVQRITSDDPEERMPPEYSKLALTQGEIELLVRWVAEGAEYAQHWAFVAPERRKAPTLKNTAWPLDRLDAHVFARLESEGLAPGPDAGPETWLRRVTFDLTGLPPTLAEIDAFLVDLDHERVADRLLASESHAERMAADWLDVARYADTYGYQNDAGRRVWPWRDWVIAAYHENLPYDEFVTWQLAGDLLEEPTREQRLATAFNRLHRQTNEGGSVEEEMRVEYVADRVHTFGTAFLGLTLECARCHDHKYDPVTQREYYSLFAFFQNIDESGLYSHFTNATPTPALALPTPEQERGLAEHVERVAEAELAVARLADETRAEFVAWLRDATLPAQEPLGAYDCDTLALENDAGEEAGRAASGVSLAEGVRGQAIVLPGDAGASFPGAGEFTRDDPFTLALYLRTPDVKERAVVAHRSRAWTDAGSQGYQLMIEDGRLSAALIHFWPGNALGIHATEPLPTQRWVHVALTYDGSSRAAGLALFVDGERVEAEIVRDALTRRITGGGPPPLTIGERFRDRGFTGGRVDELRTYARALSELEIRELFGGAGERDRAELFETWLAAVDPASGDARAELRERRRELSALRDAVPEIMTMAELPSPKTAYVLERGAYDQRREVVTAETAACLPVFPKEARRDRLGLARWLFDPAHPLTARVAVNRLWQLVFGTGLVRTAENFGSQGEAPSHPELLDELALDLIESGWDQRALLRRLVLSRTYRQSSRTDAATREHDPENRLYARAPVLRLPAEMVRDAALAVGGLLVTDVGGPSVKPYQPAGLWKEKSGLTYTPDSGAGLWRRSVYTYWKRTSPPPTMMLFDAAKRDVCVARRRPTSTPLQVLVLWNDPQFVEAARGLATRVLAAGDLDARVTRAFRMATGRAPEARERAALVELWREQQAVFAETPDDAARLLEVGEAPVGPEVDRADLAAGTLVMGAIFSSDAFVMRR